MAKKYETGTKQEVLAYMAECAIRDMGGMLESYEPYLDAVKHGIYEQDEDNEMYLEEVRAVIRDFKRLAGA